MRLSSALEFKRELMESTNLSELFGPTPFSKVDRSRGRGALESTGFARPVSLSEALGGWKASRPRASSRVARRPDVAGFAIGVTPRSEDDFRLAIRVYGGGSTVQSSPKLHNLVHMAERFPNDTELVTGVRYAPRGLTIRAGGSVGHPEVGAGTLGAFVQDGKHYYALSNNHVLANSDNAIRNDEAQQPGPLDQVQGRHAVIGYLQRWVPLSKGMVDAAIARLNESEVDYFEPHRYVGIGTLDPRPITDRYAVRRVIKRGRTTGVTRGVVSAFDLDGVVIDYETPNGRITFNEQIEFVGARRVKPFSQPGDSGSLIIDRDTLRPYALLYGGGPDDQGIDRTLGHFIPQVLSALKVEFVP